MSMMRRMHGGRYASLMPSPPVGLSLAFVSSSVILVFVTSLLRYGTSSSGTDIGNSDSILSWMAFCIRRL